MQVRQEVIDEYQFVKDIVSELNQFKMDPPKAPERETHNTTDGLPERGACPPPDLT